MERRFTPIETCPVSLETRAEGKPVIIGYASVFYDAKKSGTEYELYSAGDERVVERVNRGAFNKAMERRDDTRCLFNHNPDLILGRTASGTMRLSVDGTGLRYETEPGDTTIARDVIEHLRRKDVTGSSFAFVVDEETWTETKGEDGKWLIVRELLSVTLHDASPVVFPAYTAASSALRNAGEHDEVKAALERFRAKRQPAQDDSKLIAAQHAHYRARTRLAQIKR